jgi:hypothetical protein
MLKKKLFNTVSSALRFRHTAHVAVNKTVRTVGNGVTLSLSCDKKTYSNWRVNIEAEDCRVYVDLKQIHVYNYR